MLPGVFGCVTSLGAMLLGISDLTGISPRINLATKFLFLRKSSAYVQIRDCRNFNKKEEKEQIMYSKESLIFLKYNDLLFQT